MKGNRSGKNQLNAEDQQAKLGNRIRELRKKKGYTSLEIFAYEHGFGRTQYARYENGEDLRFSTLVRLIKCFDMTLEEFFGEGF